MGDTAFHQAMIEQDSHALAYVSRRCLSDRDFVMSATRNTPE